MPCSLVRYHKLFAPYIQSELDTSPVPAESSLQRAGMTWTMPTTPEPLAEPLGEILDHLAKPPKERRPQKGEFPYFMTTVEGVQIFLLDELTRPMHLVAETLWEEDHGRAAIHTRDEWWKLVQAAFASTIREERLRRERAVAIADMAIELRKFVEDRAQAHRELEFAFACSLIQEADRTLPTFENARFETREAWLARKRDEGVLSAVTTRRIRAAWANRILRPRRASIDASDEVNILNGIGNAQFVCTVKTKSFAPQAAEQRALMAARLGLLSISLVWARPVQALRGLNLAFDGLSQARRTLIFAGEHVLGGWTEEKQPHGPWSPRKEWEGVVAAYGPAFLAADEAIGFVLARPGESARPKLMLTLSQAMLWFHEACREPLDLVAIVKCAVALDALASGRRADGIRKLISARLGIGLNEACIGAMTPNEIVHKIYESTRNRAAHGREPPFGRDWSRTRALAEATTRRMIIECLTWASDHASLDDPARLCMV